MSYDLGDVARLAIQITDSTGTLANATSVSLVVTLPDGTTSGSLTPTNTPTGVYQYDYTPTQVGRHGVRWVATGTNAGAFTDVFDVYDSALLPIVSLADFKSHLKVTSSTDDEYLRQILDRATDLCERRANQALRRKTVTEAHDGGREALLLRQVPSLSVSSVVESGTTLAATGYVLDAAAGVLWRGSASWPSCWAAGRQNVTVTYVAGYANPPAVAVSTVLTVGKLMYEAGRVNSSRPALGMDEPSYGSDAIPEWAFRDLMTLRSPGIA